MRKETPRFLDAQKLTDFAYSINGAGGGGNLSELFNPGQTGGIVGLVQELGSASIPLVTWDSMKPEAMVCCMARLGSPGAKADNFAQEGAQALVIGLEKLCSQLKSDLPSAIFPVEATAGQMARAIRSARAASKTLGKEISILDGDVCGGLAVPAVPHAFNIRNGLRQFPDVALIELQPTSTGAVEPNIRLIKKEDPEELEDELRKMAGITPLGAVWFAWLLSPASEFAHYFTAGAVSNSIRRGGIVRRAVEKGESASKALIEANEIDSILANGQVMEVQEEHTPGFKQVAYLIETVDGTLKMVARNEYVFVYKDDAIIAKAPDIICAIGQQGPIQSHMLKAGDKISIVSATPQSLINNPQKREEWDGYWHKYWQDQSVKGLWRHPY